MLEGPNTLTGDVLCGGSLTPYPASTVVLGHGYLASQVRGTAIRLEAGSLGVRSYAQCLFGHWHYNNGVRWHRADLTRHHH